jgi:hypothetical protein
MAIQPWVAVDGGEDSARPGGPDERPVPSITVQLWHAPVARRHPSADLCGLEWRIMGGMRTAAVPTARMAPFLNIECSP